MITKFMAWREAVYPAPFGFQYGHGRNQVWWEDLEDPAGQIGNAILAAVPNTEGLYWVDFSIFDIHPPFGLRIRTCAAP